jgi:hypothetical protein
MALLPVTIPPLDPNLMTGPSRLMSGVVRTLDPVLGTEYGEFMRWLYVGVTGNVSYVKWDGTTEVLVGLASGVWHPVYSKMINSAGTTATNIVVGS